MLYSGLFGYSEATSGLFQGRAQPARRGEGLISVPGCVCDAGKGSEHRGDLTVMNGQMQVHYAPEAQVFAKNFLENDSGRKA